MNLLNLKSEKEILKLSIFSTIFLAILGLIFGLLASSATIIFDSIYGMIDALMTILALVVAKLITASTSKDIISNRLEKHTYSFSKCLSNKKLYFLSFKFFLLK